jgi:hypothetical protein
LIRGIARGEHRLGHRPRDGDVGIVPGEASFQLVIVVRANSVDDIGPVAERAKPVREADRDVELEVTPVIQLEGLEPRKRRRSRTDVHHGIEDPAAGHANQFRLTGWGLKMQTAEHAASAPRVVVLDQVGTGAKALVLILAERFQEEPALVLEDAWLKQDQPFKRCGMDLHRAINAWKYRSY